MAKYQILQKDIIDDVSGDLMDSVKRIRRLNEFVIPFKPCSSFSKVFTGILPVYSVRVYLANFFILIHHIHKDSNIITKKKGDMMTVAHMSDLVKILGISEISVKRFLAESRKNNILVNVNTTSGHGFVINPAYAYNGSGISPYLYLVFEKDYNFINSLTVSQINMYNKRTSSNYYKNIKNNFIDIYNRLMIEKHGK